MRWTKFLAVLALVVLALSGVPSVARADGPLPNGKGSIEWKLGQTLGPNQREVVGLMMAYYNSHGMTYEADMLKRTLDGTLTSSELDAIRLNGNTLLYSDYDAHWASSINCLWVTWLARPWYLFGRNEHFAQSQVGGNPCPITRMDMRVRAWTNAGVQQYDNAFGFAPASSLYARNYGEAPGHSRSDATYTNGSEVYPAIVEQSY